MKNILITGGAGYIGSHCVKDLTERGYNCLVIDNLSTGYKEAVLTPHFFKIDLTEKDAVREIFLQNKIDAVVHFAASTHVGQSVSNPIHYYQNNLVNTLNLLNAMVVGGTKAIVFSSTCAIYGEPQYQPVDESHPHNPINPYGKSKEFIESILHDYEIAYGLSFMALRYFNVAGCDTEGKLGDLRTPASLLIPLVLETLTGQRESITIFGDDYPTRDGTCIRDFIHVQDIVSAHRLALEVLLESGESSCINLGTGEGTSVLEIIHAAEAVTGKKVPFTIGPKRTGDPSCLIASDKKAKQRLGWEAELRDIEKIIATSWNWLKKNK